MKYVNIRSKYIHILYTYGTKTNNGAKSGWQV